jgi:hypothetical protein
MTGRSQTLADLLRRTARRYPCSATSRLNARVSLLRSRKAAILQSNRTADRS